VDRTRERRSDETSLKLRKLIENAPAKRPTTTASALFRGLGARCVGRTHGMQHTLADQDGYFLWLMTRVALLLSHYSDRIAIWVHDPGNTQ